MANPVVADGQEVGHWYLEMVKTDWSSTRSLLDPAPTFELGDQDADRPREYEGVVNSPGNTVKIEFGPGPVFHCSPGDAPAETNPCAYIDYVNLTQISDQKIHYHARNHGGRCVATLVIYKRDQVKVTQQTRQQSWIKGASFLVMVPEDVVDATVIGKMGPSDIFFTPSIPLTGDDARRFKLSQSKHIDGVGTYYSFIVVDPFPT
jgi:hypothetical protein